MASESDMSVWSPGETSPSNIEALVEDQDTAAQASQSSVLFDGETRPSNIEPVVEDAETQVQASGSSVLTHGETKPSNIEPGVEDAETQAQASESPMSSHCEIRPSNIEAGVENAETAAQASESSVLSHGETRPGNDDAEAAPRPKCSICTDFVDDASKENQYLPCGHLFHAECIARMMRHSSRPELEYVRCPSCRRAPEDVNAQSIDLLHNDALRGSVVVVQDNSQPDGQLEEHELPAPTGQAEPDAAGQAEPYEAGTMTDGFLQVFHGSAFHFS